MKESKINPCTPPSQKIHQQHSLAAVGVGARVGHGQQADLVVLDGKIFVGEFG